MPTRKQRAAELLERVRRGPALSDIGKSAEHGRALAEAQRGYRIWADTWIIPGLVALIPELKGTGK